MTPPHKAFLFGGSEPVFSLQQPQEGWAGEGLGGREKGRRGDTRALWLSRGSPHCTPAAERASTPGWTCHPASERTGPHGKPPGVWEADSPERAGILLPAAFPELAGCHGGRRRERRGRLVKWVRVSSFCRGGRWAPCSRREAAFCVLGPLPALPRPWLSSLRNGKMLPQQTALSPAGSWQQDHLSPAHLSPRQGCLEGEARLGTVRLGLNFTSTIRSV